jgi:GT2 family glycosyltransferase
MAVDGQRHREHPVASGTEAAGEHAMRVSVAVCTTRPWEAVKRCLDSLFAQTLAWGRFEILVVDNSPQRREVPQWLSSRAAGEPDASDTGLVRWLHEPRVGLSYARNLAARQAAGELIAYIDDDATAEAGWLENMIAPFASDPSVACVGGTIRLAFPPRLPRWYHSSLDGWWSRYDACPDGVTDAIGYSSLPFGANLAIRKSVWAKLDGFDVRMGRGSGILGGGEEIDFCLRARLAGLRVCITPAGVVVHHVESQRMGLAPLWREAREAGLSLAALQPQVSGGGFLRQAFVQLLKCGYPFGLLPLGRRLNYLLRGRMFLVAALRRFV